MMQNLDRLPRVAIIDSNTLAAIGLKNLLKSIMSAIEVDSYRSFKELMANGSKQYYHYFATLSIVLANYDFFFENRRKTIVMTASAESESRLDKFHCLTVCCSEHVLVKALLSLEQSAHAHGHSLPMPQNGNSVHKKLSDREIEVLTLIVKGYINKEIADKLNVSLPTVITHRRNIVEKLGRKSVSSLTIYAVMQGYVSIDEI